MLPDDDDYDGSVEDGKGDTGDSWEHETLSGGPQRPLLPEETQL